MSDKTDVLVIGGGPGGSTAAISLAGRGYQVTVLEKSRHPRFHIGESLLPANLPLLERLGVGEEIRAIGMQKWGVELVSPWHALGRQTFEFAEAWRKSLPFAYQVRRSQFDEILIRRASACEGVQVIEGCRVTDVDLARGTDHPVLVQAVHEDDRTESWEARFLIDASGRDTFLGNRLGTKKRDRRHNSSAMYAHLTGVERLAGRAEGNISIFWFDHGWIWLIPLADGTTSIGVVAWPYYMKRRTKPVREYFLETLTMCRALDERLRGAELVSEVHATGNYSYRCERAWGDNHLLVGDAYAFIDPLFSSGVLLAMTTAEQAAATVDTCLRKPSRAIAAMKAYHRIAYLGPRQYAWFIHHASRRTLLQDLFMAPRNLLRMKEAVLALLAGDIYGRTPIGPSLFAFKTLYYLLCLMHPRRALASRRQRRINIQPAPGDGIMAD